MASDGHVENDTVVHFKNRLNAQHHQRRGAHAN